jgi:hypothetical protein
MVLDDVSAVRSTTAAATTVPSCCGHHLVHHGGERNIIEWVVQRLSTNIVFWTLMRTNYTEWSLVMKVNL